MAKLSRVSLMLLAVAGLVLLTGCSKLADPLADQPETIKLKACDQFTYATDIIAGQNEDVGDISIAFTYDNIFVKYTTIPTWFLTQVHVMVVDDPADIPTNGGGAAPGQFDYKAEFAATNTYTVTVPMRDEWRDCEFLYMAAHCAVEQWVNDSLWQTQTGWGDGEPLPGRNWGMYFQFRNWKSLNLPPGVISSRFTAITGGDVPSQFELANVPADYDIWSGTWSSFCLDHGIYIYNQWYHNTRVWSSYDPTMPDYAKYIRGTTDPVPYGSINYLLNMVIFGWNEYTADPLPFTYDNIMRLQHIFWYYRGNLAYSGLSAAEKAMVAIGDLHSTFRPAVGQWMAVIMDNGTSVQLCFIVVDP